MRSRMTRVALITAVVLITAACSSSDSTKTTTTTVVTTQPPTTTAPATITTTTTVVAAPNVTTVTSPSTTTTTLATTTTVVDAEREVKLAAVQALVDARFEALNVGDVEAVLALFGADATFSNNTGSITRADWEQILVWDVAQGTVISPSECTLSDEVQEVSVTVVCHYSNFDALVQALDGAPVPITATLTVTPDGISEESSVFGFPTFNVFGAPFRTWMNKHHPADELRVGFGNWTTVEEAEENGILTARYAAEWATFLKDNGCGYSDGC